MKIHFYSFENSKCIESYVTDSNNLDNSFEFIDNSNPNTKINISIVNNNSIHLKRFGDVFTDIIFTKNLKTEGIYKNNLGLEFNFSAYTKDIKIEKDKIYIEYDYYVFDDFISKFKIILLLK